MGKAKQTKITQTCGNRTLFTCRHQTLIFHRQKLKPDFPPAETEAWLSTGRNWSLTFHRQKLKPDFPPAETEAWLSTGRNDLKTRRKTEKKPSLKHEETELFLIAETKLCIPISCRGFPFSTPARPLSSTQQNKTTSKNKHPWGGRGGVAGVGGGGGRS